MKLAYERGFMREVSTCHGASPEAYGQGRLGERAKPSKPSVYQENRAICGNEALSVIVISARNGNIYVGGVVVRSQWRSRACRTSRDEKCIFDLAS